MRLRVGVVGLGQGLAHARALRAVPDVEVAALCDADEPRLARAGAEHGVDRCYLSFDELLGQPDLDVIVIATPDHLHGPMAIAALRAGKHVLSEIPMATDPDQMREIVALADQHGLAYQMGNQVRYAPCLVSAKAVLDSGRFGQIFYGEAEYLHNMSYAQYASDGTRRWRASQSEPQTTMLGGGPHALDCLRWLMGVDNFVEVHAYGNRFGLTDRPIDDFTVALFKAASGAIAKVAVAYGVARPYCLYYSVYGTGGTFERTRVQELDSDRTVNYLYFSDTPHLAQMIPMDVYHWTDPSLPAAGRHGTMEVAQAFDFVRAVHERRRPTIDARESARSCLALWAALESARTGQPVPIAPV